MHVVATDGVQSNRCEKGSCMNKVVIAIMLTIGSNIALGRVSYSEYSTATVYGIEWKYDGNAIVPVYKITKDDVYPPRWEPTSEFYEAAIKPSTAGSIVIPDTLTGISINSIGNSAFRGCSKLMRVTIPESITSIGGGVFYGCSALKTIVFKGDAPICGNEFYADMTVYVKQSSTGWGVSIPGKWHGVDIAYLKVVKFNANGGNVSAVDINLVPGDAVGTLPTPTRLGYTFDGWYTAANGGAKISASTTVSADMTCYAHWTANKYTITFDANGGEGGTSTSLSYDTTLGSLPEATRYDFDFGGWWTAANGGLEISSSTKVMGDITYYAHWIDPIPELTGVVTDDMVSEALAGSADSIITSKITTPSLYTEYRQWIDSKELSHKAAKASPNAWLSYALDAPTLMAKNLPLASEDVVIESIEPSSITAEAFDLVVNIAGAEIGEGARLAEALGVEGVAELNESAFSSEGLSVTLERTADGKVKATVTPDGAPPSFFLRVRVT